MRLYFVRHGESEANVQKIISNRGFVHPLTQRGVEQAKALTESLANDPVRHIFSSPLQRAVQTAEFLARHFELDYTLADALREFDCGILESNTDQKSRDMVFEIWGDWVLNQNWGRQFEEGDSFETIKARFMPFIASVIEQFRECDDTIALVGHDGTYRSMLPLVLENIDFNFVHEHGISNTGVVRSELREGSLVCTQWCDIDLR